MRAILAGVNGERANGRAAVTEWQRPFSPVGTEPVRARSVRGGAAQSTRTAPEAG